MLKSLSLTICASLLAFAGSAFATANKEKIICHHGAAAMFQLEMDWSQGKATISERIKKQWVPTYKNAKIVRNSSGSKAFIAEGTARGAVDQDQTCGRLDQTLTFDIQEVKGKRVGSATRAFTMNNKNGSKICKVKAPPPDLGDYAISLKCK